MRRLSRADDRCGDDRVARHPRERDLCPGYAASGRDRCDRLDDDPVARLVAVERFAEFVGRGTFRCFIPIAGEATARQRTPRNRADLLVGAQRQHLTLFLPVEQVVVVLHRYEARPAVESLKMQGFAEFPGEHRGGSDISGLSRFHNVIQRLQRFLDRHRMVPAVDLVEVDVVRAEPGEAGVDLGEDRLARKPAPVRARAHGTMNLRGEDDFVTVREILQSTADDLFTGAIRVDVRGVEEVDACFDRLLDEGSALVLRQTPRVVAAVRVSEGHTTKGNRGDIEAGVAEFHIFHRCSSVSIVFSGCHLQWVFAGLLREHEEAFAGHRSVRSGLKPVMNAQQCVDSQLIVEAPALMSMVHPYSISLTNHRKVTIRSLTSRCRYGTTKTMFVPVRNGLRACPQAVPLIGTRSLPMSGSPHLGSADEAVSYTHLRAHET